MMFMAPTPLTFFEVEHFLSDATKFLEGVLGKAPEVFDAVDVYLLSFIPLVFFDPKG